MTRPLDRGRRILTQMIIFVSAVRYLVSLPGTETTTAPSRGGHTKEADQWPQNPRCASFSLRESKRRAGAATASRRLTPLRGASSGLRWTGEMVAVADATDTELRYGRIGLVDAGLVEAIEAEQAKRAEFEFEAAARYDAPDTPRDPGRPAWTRSYE